MILSVILVKSFEVKRTRLKITKNENIKIILRISSTKTGRSTSIKPKEKVLFNPFCTVDRPNAVQFNIHLYSASTNASNALL